MKVHFGGVLFDDTPQLNICGRRRAAVSVRDDMVVLQKSSFATAPFAADECAASSIAGLDLALDRRGNVS